MKRALLLMTGGAFALLVGTTATAAMTSGQVIDTDPATNQITVETAGGTRYVFDTNSETKIEHRGADVALGDLQKNARVTVTTEQAPTDPSMPMLASRVQVDEMAVSGAQPTSESAAARADRQTEEDAARMRTAQVESAERDVRDERPARLPATASPIPLIALFGASALATGLVLRLRRRR